MHRGLCDTEHSLIYSELSYFLLVLAAASTKINGLSEKPDFVNCVKLWQVVGLSLGRHCSHHQPKATLFLILR
jgi:hypothetical protein